MGSKKKTPLLLGLAALTGLLNGCVSSGRQQLFGGKDDPVRRMEWKQGSDFQPYAERARRLAKEVYPKIVAQLGVEPATVPTHFDIVFDHLTLGKMAETQTLLFRSCPRIVVNTNYFTTNKLSAPRVGTDPGNFEVIMVHEMAHVAQQCDPKKVPEHWVEGVAEFVRCRLGYTNRDFAAECTGRWPHYSSGHGCAGAFLLFVEARHGTNFVPQLHAALRQRSYTDAFFKNVTGETLGEVWAQFQGTPALTPAAAKMNQLSAWLGYVDGKPPKDLHARFDAFLKSQPGGTNTVAALQFMQKLADQGRLPGFSKRKRPVIMHGEEMEASVVAPNVADPDAYPVSRKLFCYDSQSNDTYWYIVVRQSPTSDWELTNAWRTNLERRVVETYR